MVPDRLIEGPISFHLSVLPSLAFPGLVISRWLPQDWALGTDTATTRGRKRASSKARLFPRSTQETYPHVYLDRTGSLTPKPITHKGAGAHVCIGSIRVDQVLWGHGRCKNKIGALPAWKSRKLVVGWTASCVSATSNWWLLNLKSTLVTPLYFRLLFSSRNTKHPYGKWAEQAFTMCSDLGSAFWFGTEMYITKVFETFLS